MEEKIKKAIVTLKQALEKAYVFESNHSEFIKELAGLSMTKKVEEALEILKGMVE